MLGIFVFALLLSIALQLGWITLSRRHIGSIGFAFVMLVSGIPFLATLMGFTVVGLSVGLFDLTMLTILAYLAGIFTPVAFLFVAAWLFKFFRFIVGK